MDEVKPAARLPTVEHREPCESRGSRTVLGAPGGEIPPGDSSEASFSCVAAIRPESGVKPTCRDVCSYHAFGVTWAGGFRCTNRDCKRARWKWLLSSGSK